MYNNFNPFPDKKPILHQQPIPNQPQQFQQPIHNQQRQFQQPIHTQPQFQQPIMNPQQFQQPVTLPPQNFPYPQAPIFYNNPNVNYPQMPSFIYQQQQQEAAQITFSNTVEVNEIPQTIAKEPSSNIIQASSIKYRQHQASQVLMQVPSQPQTTLQSPSYNYPNQQVPQIPQAQPSGPHYGPTSTLNEFRRSTLYTNLPIKPHEVSSHYQNRKYVYEKVLNDLNDHDKAICYSNIWCHMNYLGTRYPKNVEETVIKYGPFLPKVLRQKLAPENPQGYSTDTKTIRQNTRVNLKEE